MKNNPNDTFTFETPLVNDIPNKNHLKLETQLQNPTR